ncbi:MAG: dephospho-CoA kinase [Nitrospirota bacterium]
MIVVGLTGNYGMGKSTVAGMFKEAGALTIDTDEIVKELLREPAVINEIKNAFDEDVVANNVINKKKLADIVFQNPHLRISLENILHPKVFEEVNKRLSRIHSGDAAVVIIEAPVLFERGYQNRFDKIITVFASEEVTLKRLKAKGIPEEEALRRLKSQFPSGMKIGKSDFTIDNSGDPEETRKQVETVYEELAAMERRHGNN